MNVLVDFEEEVNKRLGSLTQVPRLTNEVSERCKSLLPEGLEV